MTLKKGHHERNTLAVTGTRAARDAALLRQYFGATAPGTALAPVNLHTIQQLENNKLSLLPFLSHGKGQTEEMEPELRPILQRHQLRQQEWRDSLALATSLFDSLDVRYVPIKALRSPCALMSDVDFLAPLPRDIARMAAALEGAGYALYRFRILSHALKIMAERSAGPSANVDLYPAAMWIRKHVLDGASAIERRRRATVRGVPTWEPCPEDDLYLVATHAFAHGAIHLAELDHGARILARDALDWAYLLDTAAAFGCRDALYLYLRLLATAVESLESRSPVPAAILTALERTAACRGVMRWLDSLDGLSFPLYVPLRLCTVASARHHLPAISSRLSWTETACDAATHALIVGSHLLRRD
jgi:hypothetical protein